MENPNKKGWAPLHLAAMKGEATIAKILIAGGADTEEASANSGWTPLLLAANYGHSNVVKVLLDEGVDVNATMGKTPSTALHWAISGRHMEAVRLLLERGAIVSQEYLPMMKHAIGTGSSEIVGLLEEHTMK